MKGFIQVVGRGLFVGVAALGAVLTGQQVQAAEQITVNYQGSEVTLVRRDLESFVETGVLPTDLQTLLGTDETVPERIRTVLAQEIRVPEFVEDFLESATGEFALGQLDDVIGSTSGSTEETLLSLKSAFNRAGSDRQISFLELMQQYPEQNVRVDLSNLETTYNRVVNFVERVQPALEVAKGFLSEIVCDCETNTATDAQATYASASSDPNGKPCNQAHDAIAQTADQPKAAEQ